MSIGAITNARVQQVNFNGGTDNVTRIDLKKNGVTTTVWRKVIQATLNCNLYWLGSTVRPKKAGGYPVRYPPADPNAGRYVLGDGSSDGFGVATGRTSYWNYGGGSYAAGQSFAEVPFTGSAPSVRESGFGYVVGRTYNVMLPSTISRSGSRTTKNRNGSNQLPFRITITSVRTSAGTFNTSGDKGAINTFSMPNGTMSSDGAVNNVLGQRYSFRNSSNQYLSSVNSGVFTLIGTVEMPTDNPTPAAAPRAPDPTPDPEEEEEGGGYGGTTT